MNFNLTKSEKTYKKVESENYFIKIDIKINKLKIIFRLSKKTLN